MITLCAIDFDHEDIAVCFSGKAGMQKDLYVKYWKMANIQTFLFGIIVLLNM